MLVPRLFLSRAETTRRLLVGFPFVGCSTLFLGASLFLSLFALLRWLVGVRGAVKRVHRTGRQDLGIDLGFWCRRSLFFSFFFLELFLSFSVLFSSSTPFFSRYTPHFLSLVWPGLLGRRRTAGSWDRGNGGILGLLCLLCFACFALLGFSTQYIA